MAGLTLGNMSTTRRGMSKSVPTTVRLGSRSLRCFPDAYYAIVRFPDAAGGAFTDRWVGRCYLRFATLPNATIGLLSHAASGPRMQFNQTDSKLYAAVDSTLGATGVTVTTGVWYRIDFNFFVGAGANDTCDVQVDGVACGQASAASASTTNPHFDFGGLEISTGEWFYDDFVLSITAGDYPIGAGNVYHFVPTSDGTHNVAGTGDFQRGNTATDILNATTTAYQLVDDVPLPTGTVSETDNIRAVAPVNATDYVEVVFGPAPGISTPTTEPRAVDVIAAYHQLGTGSSNLRLALNDNGTTDDVLNVTAAGVTTYRYICKHYADPPSAASAWTVVSGNGNFNNVRLRVYSSDATVDQCLDGVMIEAGFAEVAGHPVHRRFGGVPHLGTGRGTGGRAW